MNNVIHAESQFKRATAFNTALRNFNQMVLCRKYDIGSFTDSQLWNAHSLLCLAYRSKY